MDFAWTEDQQALYSSVVEFARNELTPALRDVDEPDRLLREGWNRCARQGILAGLLPEEHGGKGLNALSCALVMQALGYGCRDAGLLFAIGAHLFACMVPVLAFGSAELRSRYLPRLGSGDWIAANVATEAEAGSDVFAMRTRAERQGDRYVLHGSKCYSTNAPVADLFLIYAVTGSGKPAFLDISAFLVESGTPGLSISKPHKKMGLETALLGDVLLDGCTVPAGNRLGREGDGGAIFIHSMNWERACLLALYLGTMERQLEETVRFVKTRRQSGKALKEFQAVSHRLADMKVRLEAARLLTYRAAWMLDAHPRPTISIDSAICKLMVSEAAVQSSLEAIQLHGGRGILESSGVEIHLRDALLSRIYSGTSEILRNTIAKGLGL